MKLALAFILGMVIAAGVAVVVVKRNMSVPAAPAQPAAMAPEKTAVEPATPAPAPVAQVAPAPVTPPTTTPVRTPSKPRASRPSAVAELRPAEPVAAPVTARNAEPPAVETTAPKPAEQRPEPVVALPPPPPPKPEPRRVTIPAGTLLTVRLAQSLNSDSNQAGDSFQATLDQPLVVDGLVLAERGARADGRVVESEKAGRVKGLATLSIQLVHITTSDGQRLSINTSPFEKTADKSTGSDAAKVGAGAAIGAVIGAIAGGGKGAAIGAGAGGAAGTGTVLATRGKAAELKVETRISFRLQEPVSATEKLR
jgi:hypothetical protein